MIKGLYLCETCFIEIVRQWGGGEICLGGGGSFLYWLVFFGLVFLGSVFVNLSNYWLVSKDICKYQVVCVHLMLE